MPKRKPSPKRVAKKAVKNVSNKRKRTSVSKAPTKRVTGLNLESTKKELQVPKSIARDRSAKAGEMASSKDFSKKTMLGYLTGSVKYDRAAQKEANKLGYKSTGDLTYAGSKLVKKKPAKPMVTGAKSKTVGSPSTSKTVSKRKYKKSTNKKK